MNKATDDGGNEYAVLNLADTQLISKYSIDEAYRYLSHTADEGPYFYKASVECVVDGDTVDMDIDLGFAVRTRQRVRIKGIIPPEAKKRSEKEKVRGIEAKNMMVHLNELFGPTVFLTSHGVGRYGRVLGDLWYRVDKTHWVNAAQLMVGEKLATPYHNGKRVNLQDEDLQ